VPFYFGYADNCLYSFSTVGRKIDWMRINPLVCVEADEIRDSEHWASVIAFGRYEELPDMPEWKNERAIAHKLLAHKPEWWEPGYVKTILHGTERPLIRPIRFLFRSRLAQRPEFFVHIQHFVLVSETFQVKLGHEVLGFGPRHY
jgi:uncharacterized protein